MFCLIHEERISVLNERPAAVHGDYVLYWMQAAVRSECNHALEYAARLANSLEKPLAVVFGLAAGFPGANLRHYHFLAEGLLGVKKSLEKRNINFFLYLAQPSDAAVAAAKKAAVAVTDMGYLRVQRKWRTDAADRMKCRLYMVETEAVVPIAAASDKEEFAARTIRPKIHRALSRYLVPLERTKLENAEKVSLSGAVKLDGMDAGTIAGKLDIDRSVGPSPVYRGGEAEALRRMRVFIEERLEHYAELRNDPCLDFLSDMSPYLHFGQISPLRIALSVLDATGAKNGHHEAFMREHGRETSAARYLEELLVRRELSFNFCHYNQRYDDPDGALPEWAVKTLEDHSGDIRKYEYSREELERGATHDHYWNAAQLQMIATGKMHNYMRMYWGKKIIEWTRDFREAYRTALYLNDKYELDGRDPNGFTGVAWCFGKHDRPWTTRKIFGTVRYMNDKGLERKFDAEGYARKVSMMCGEYGIELASLTHLMERE